MPHVPRNIQAPHTASTFWAQWNSTTPRMALFILITPQTFWTSVSPVGITSNTRNMTLPGHPGITFYSTPGITPTQVEQVLDEPTNLEMTGIYQTGIFEQVDVVAGKWNFATIEVFSASWEHPEYGELVHGVCKSGELKDYQTYFTAEARGIMSLLSQNVNKVTSRFCRVKDFRDAECGHTSATVTIDAVVYNIEQSALPIVETTPLPEGLFFSDGDVVGNNPPIGFFANGKVTCVTGANAGVSREISQSAPSGGFVRVYVKRTFPFEIEMGDTFDLVAGCNRSIEDCMKFENIVNRRAEDWIPTVEAVHRIPPAS